MRKLTLNIEPHPSDTAAWRLDGADHHRLGDACRQRNSPESCSTEIERFRQGETRHRPMHSFVAGAKPMSTVAHSWEAGRTDDCPDPSSITYVSRR